MFWYVTGSLQALWGPSHISVHIENKNLKDKTTTNVESIWVWPSSFVLADTLVFRFCDLACDLADSSDPLYSVWWTFFGKQSNILEVINSLCDKKSPEAEEIWKWVSFVILLENLGTSYSLETNSQIDFFKIWLNAVLVRLENISRVCATWELLAVVSHYQSGSSPG